MPGWDIRIEGSRFEIDGLRAGPDGRIGPGRRVMGGGWPGRAGWAEMALLRDEVVRLRSRRCLHRPK